MSQSNEKQQVKNDDLILVCTPSSEDFGKEQRVDVYDKNANIYDDDMAFLQYGAPDHAANALHSCLKGKTDARILDVGCGTGLIARKLKKKAPYNNMDGLDPSQNSLDLTEDLYVNVFNQYFYLNSGFPYQSYDATVSSGVFMPNHLPAEAIIEMVNLVKPGGFVVNAAREAFLTDDEDLQKIRPYIVEMVKSGKVEIVTDELYKNHFDGNPGRLMVLKRLK